MKKRKIVLLIALTLIMTGAFGLSDTAFKVAYASPSFERVNPVKAVVTADALNVRTGPGTNYDIVCVLKRDDTVLVFGRLGTWYAVYEQNKGCVGVVSGSYIRTVDSNVSTGTAPAPSPLPSPLPKENPPATGIEQGVDGITAEEQNLLNLINAERAKYGVAPLKFDSELMNSARTKAADMVKNNYFSHYSPTYGSPFDMMRKFGVEFKSAGENIAGNSSLQGAVKAWMQSEGHRKNIVNGKYNYTGIGIVSSKTYGKIIVQQFIQK